MNTPLNDALQKAISDATKALRFLVELPKPNYNAEHLLDIVERLEANTPEPSAAQGAMTFLVRRNRCECHPETCACDDWVISDDKGEKWATHFTKEGADRLCKLLNRAAQPSVATAQPSAATGIDFGEYCTQRIMHIATRLGVGLNGGQESFVMDFEKNILSIVSAVDRLMDALPAAQPRVDLTNEQLYEVFEKARAGSDKPVGILRGIRAVLAAATPGQEAVWDTALEEAARKATGFLVGDPANGIPLRSPSPHQIADAIRAMKSASVSEQKGDV